MENLPKRLIEVDLPIRRISEQARREKSIRHGHISTLHIWWARRPLAACRAALCALLWPDPADPHCPHAFIDTVKAEMLAWTPHERYQKMSVVSRPRFEQARQDRTVFDQPETLRVTLLDFIAEFANWNNSTDADYLATARALTQSAHEALGGIPGTRPLVVDSFAGGGSIPMEALRVGGDAFASDLNPIPVLLNKVILEYVPKYGQRLADEVRKWGQWIKDEAEKELVEFYPRDEGGATPIAYLWARTIISEDPGQGSPPVEVPLMRSLWLSKKANNRKALRWRRDNEGRVQCETLEVPYADGQTLTVRRPLLEIFSPSSEKEVEQGTVARGSATCPITGYTTPVASVRKQMRARRGGASDSRLFCVVTTRPGQTGRFYRLPLQKDIEVTRKAAAELARISAERDANGDRFVNLSPDTDGPGAGLPFPCKRESSEETNAAGVPYTELANKPGLVPNEPLPPRGTLGFRVQGYGMLEWGDLFTPRQLLSLTTLVSLLHQVEKEIKQRENDVYVVGAITSILSIICCKVIDKSTSLCRWKSTSEGQAGGTFGRQALPIVFDFSETNPLFSGTGSVSAESDLVLDMLSHGTLTCNAVGTPEQASADAHPLPNGTAQCFFTDPPYYDAVPYADLSDFFYVWFKRTLGAAMPDLFSDELAPKDDECIVDEVKGKDNEYFERMMGKAMAEGCRILSPEGIGCIVFAHKSTSGWEAQLQAMVDAGWTITASWPIDTEMGSRLRAMNSAALASSIHLVVRPRAVNTHNTVGDWRDVLEELPKRINTWLPHLAQEGVVGADAIFACLGPALEIYSRYERVEKASGELVSLREYLEQVWTAVSRAALSSIVASANLSGFEPDARLTALWLWTVAAGSDGTGNKDNETDDESTSKSGFGGFTLEYDTARKIAQGTGASLERMDSIVHIKGDKATLLPVTQRTSYLFGKDEATPQTPRGRRKPTPQADLFAELMVREPEAEYLPQQQPVSKPGETLLDRIHQSMILFATGRGEALRRFLVEDGIGLESGLWELAQALSALYPGGSDEKRWVDGVLARKKGLGL